MHARKKRALGKVVEILSDVYHFIVELLYTLFYFIFLR